MDRALVRSILLCTLSAGCAPAPGPDENATVGEATLAGVVFVAPRAGATVSGTVTVTVSAPTHTARVALYVDGTWVQRDTTAASWSFVLDTAPLAEGAHTLRAVARASSGATLGSASESVIVAPRIKPTIAGLIQIDGVPPQSYWGAVSNHVVEAYWTDLQPSQGGPLAAGNAIDQAITQVQSLNAANPGLNMRLKVRIYAGIHAPDWAKSIGGAPVTVTDPTDNKTGTIGRFWLPAFGAAYDDLVQKVAAKYDAVPELLDVTVARCTTVYSEPFIRDASDAASRQALLAAGFSAQADEQCLLSQIDSHKVFARTRSSLAFNPYQHINADGSWSTDEAFTEQAMDYCRSTLGARCVLENNSIRWPELGSAYAQMYDHMALLGAPITFQTATLPRIGSLLQTLAWAVQKGADSVELPGGYESVASEGALAPYDQDLRGNAP
jgi:hypothetical protein